MQISIVFGSITGESATELKWSSAACCLWANSRGRGLVKKERNLFPKATQFWKNGRLLPQCLSPPEHLEKNPATFCQISPRLSPEFLLPFKNTIIWETAGGH